MRAFINKVKFPQENGVSTLELDRPDETALAKQFINDIRKDYKADKTLRCKLIRRLMNMALL